MPVSEIKEVFEVKDHQEIYKEEAYELLSELESSLLELEQTPDDQELIGQIFRALHTIKGSGAMFGFDRIAAFTHEVETVFDMIRDGKIAVTSELINLSLSATDQIKLLLERQDQTDSEELERLIRLFQAYTASHDKAKSILSEKPSSGEKTRPLRMWNIRFYPAPNIFTFGTNPILLLNELRTFGECSILPDISGIPPLEDYVPEACYIRWEIVLDTCKTLDDIKDVFIFVEDTAEITFEEISGDSRQQSEERIPENTFWVQPSDALPLEYPEEEFPDQISVLEKKRPESAITSIRVPAEKLDTLVNLVGELVTVQARLSRKASFQSDPELHAISEEVERLTAELRDNTMSIRMLPISTTFGAFKRLVRDLSAELGKEVNLVTDGGETELDKTVIDQLKDPLLHIIRNCIDHGIEPPELRAKAGKPKQGTVKLSAFHSGASVLIQISDDGAGLNADAIRESAIEKGLITPDTELSEDELYELIFISGLSTSKQVTDISGRGVGMDVVKRRIESLHGTTEIKTQKGIGTTVILKLPLTLAIIDGLLVTIGDNSYVLPLSAVEECVELTREEALKAKGRNMMNLRGDIVPYLSLKELFQYGGELLEIEQIVIAEGRGTRIGLEVDHVKGQHQTVIKPLGNAYRNIEWVSGATILGDGSVALILDINSLIDYAEKINVTA